MYHASGRKAVRQMAAWDDSGYLDHLFDVLKRTNRKEARTAGSGAAQQATKVAAPHTAEAAAGKGDDDIDDGDELVALRQLKKPLERDDTLLSSSDSEYERAQAEEKKRRRKSKQRVEKKRGAIERRSSQHGEFEEDNESQSSCSDSSDDLLSSGSSSSSSGEGNSGDDLQVSELTQKHINLVRKAIQYDKRAVNKYDHGWIKNLKEVFTFSPSQVTCNKKTD